MKILSHIHRQLFIPLLALLVLISSTLGCTSKPEKKDQKQIGVQSKSRAIYFDYDSIFYYSASINEMEALALFDKKQQNELDSLRYGVLLDAIPKSVTLCDFIPKLEQIGFRKTIIDSSKFERINSIFSEKKSKEHLETSCIAVYRDLLIFKKNGQVVGTAKICFGCRANQIHGTKANTELFGQDGDYGNIRKIT